jgi:Putative peptidoglycan binding domain
MKNTTFNGRNVAFALSVSALCTLQAMAAMTTDANGNVGFDSLAECEAAISGSGVKFYQPFTSHPPLKRSGEADVKQMTLKDLTNASYARGSCDIGVGRSNERDGVSRTLIGKYIPFSANMPVNAYYDATGKLVRATMQQCDNNFSGAFPRPLGVQTVVSNSSECFATVQVPAKFETKTERVVKVPATKRVEVIPATYKTVSEQVLVSPEIKRQIPVPATYKTVQETVVVQPATEREEPIPATYKSVPEQILVKPESKRLEVTPATFKAVTEQVLATPERKELKVIPAEYAEREETVEDRPATTRVETIPPTFKTITEQVLVRPESLSYEPIALPLKTISDEVVRREASKRLEVVPATYKTETQQVLVRAASKRLETVPATFEIVTEQIKISDATKEWKRGRAWIGRAIDVRPIRGFAVSADGRSTDGNRVDVAAAANASSRAPVETRIIGGDNTNLDDDVMCLVEVPAQFQTITRQVLKTPASVREVEVAAEYTTVTRQVLDRAASTREVDIPETRQTITRQVIDVEKLKAAGYKFDSNGDITTTPSGERVLRAATLRQGASSAAGAAGGVGTKANAKSAGADSGAEAYVREIKFAAQYATRTSQVIDQPASVRTLETPSTSKVIKTRVEINPARTEEIVIPATFRTVTSQVVDKPATTREIVIPAEYRTVERRVVDTAASSRKIPVPAVTQVVTRRMVDQQASVREESTPAVYRTLSRQVIDVAASTRDIDVPAQFEDISYQVKSADARIERRSILCETNATPAKLMEIQRALKAAGYEPGPINGVLRAQTMSAVNAYQTAKGLPVDGYLNLETVKSLGVTPN